MFVGCFLLCNRHPTCLLENVEHCGGEPEQAALGTADLLYILSWHRTDLSLKSSMQVSHTSAIQSPAREATAATHASTMLYTEIMS